MKTVAKTFDELRLVASRSSKGNLCELPPTSSVVRGHIKRCWYSVRLSLNLLGNQNHHETRPEAYGWDLSDGFMKPDKCMLYLPSKYVAICSCKGTCASNQCKCRKLGVKCVFYCHGPAGRNSGSCKNLCN